MKALLNGSKELCAEGQADEQAGELAPARSAWIALSEVVKDDKATWQKILNVTGEVHERLEDLKSTFSKQWRNQPHKSTQLSLGVVKAEHGARLYVVAMTKLAGAFVHWEGHDCAGAHWWIDTTNEQHPPAVDVINKGMEILKSLH